MGIKKTVTLTRKDLKKILEEKFKSKIKSIYYDVETSGHTDYGDYKQTLNFIEFVIDDRNN